MRRWRYQRASRPEDPSIVKPERRGGRIGGSTSGPDHPIGRGSPSASRNPAGGAEQPLSKRIVLFSVVLLALGSAASAGQLNVEAFRPSEHPGDLFGVKTNAIADGFEPGFGLVAHWGRNPLVFVAGQGADEVSHAVVQDQLAFELIASIALLERLDVAVAAPLFVQGSGGAPLVGGVDADGFAMGDLRLSVKTLVVRDADSGFGFGVDVTASFPTARARSYAGDDAFTVAPLLLLDYAGDVRVALNAGWRLRSAEAVLDSVRVGHELLLGLGAEVPLYAGLSLGGELQTATDAAAPYADDKTNQLEGRFGVRYRFQSGLSVEGGGGAGFLEGYGNVAARAFVGLRFELPGAPEPMAVVEAPLPPPAPVPPARRPVVRAAAAAEAKAPARGPDDVQITTGAAAEPCLPPDYLTPPVYFETGRERVPPKWRPILDDAARRLREEPALGVRLVAHADERWGDGTWAAANLRLSWRRARWVQAALVRRGVDPARIAAEGVGDTRPLGDSSTPEGRRGNQCVELFIDGSSR